MIDSVKNIIMHFIKVHMITITLLTVWILLRKYANVPENWNDKIMVTYDVLMFSILGFIIYLFDIESNHDFVNKHKQENNKKDIQQFYNSLKQSNGDTERKNEYKNKILNMIKSSFYFVQEGNNEPRYEDRIHFSKVIFDYSKIIAFMISLFFLVYLLFHVYISSPPVAKAGVAFLLIGLFAFFIVRQLFDLRYTNKENKYEIGGIERSSGFHIADMLLYPVLFFRDFFYYIYCLFKDTIGSIFTSNGRALLVQKIMFFLKSDSNNNTATRYAMITITVCLSLIFFHVIYPPLSRFVGGIWGKHLLRDPIFIENKKVVGDLKMLYGRYRDKPRYYSYSLSSWVFIDQNNRSRNYKSNMDANIINFGSIPRLTYNARDEMLRVFMKKGTDNEIMIYETKDFSRQYWNHFFFNYDDGVMDIFINNELVASVNDIIPYLTKDEIIVGDDNGLLGGIRDVIFTDKSRNRNMIHLMYIKERWMTELHTWLHSYFLSS